MMKNRLRPHAVALLAAAAALAGCLDANQPQTPAPAEPFELASAATTSTVAPAGVPAGVPAGAQPATVSRHVDGDTLWVTPLAGAEDARFALATGAAHRVRLLLVDTPETVHPERSAECGGAEASAATAELAPVGTLVWLVADQRDTDRYGRPLRYVWTAHGVDIGARLLEQGLARVSLFPSDDLNLDQYRRIEAHAQESEAGLWGTLCPQP